MKFSLILGLCVHFWKTAGTQGNSGNINYQYLDTDLMKVSDYFLRILHRYFKYTFDIY